MPLRLLEERCRRLIQLMQEGSAAIERQDARALNSLSAASLELIAQIERAWCLTLSTADGRVDHADWEELRKLMAEAMNRSALNQQRMRRVKVDTGVQGKYLNSLHIPLPTSPSTRA